MRLTEGFQAVAFRLQEDATQLSQRDICSRLSDALRDIGSDNDEYYYIVDIFGDDQSGDVIYSCNGNLMKAAYEFSTTNGKQVAAIDVENAVDVMPRTSYEEEADDEDHYASLESAFKRDKLYTELPLYERFISKAERAGADAGSFAGKGQSFPILKPGDVMAAVRSMGRAGSANFGISTLKANIIRIAKKKGWTKYLPKSWQNGGDDSKESKHATGVGSDPGGLRLVESATTMETIVLKEAKADYEIKLIAPGKGSSAFYPKEVLQRDGPKVFKAGTHVYLNHPTAAEEAQRPEGDVANLAGVLTTDAAYQESHAKGPGLYARMKVFADHGQMVEEKAAHVGMSIRASGKAESGTKRDGLPVLSELTSAESVDVVTRAGAGGMILTEAARGAESQQQGADMDLKEVQKLIDQSTGPLRERALRGDAIVEANRALAGVSLRESAKQYVIDNVLAQGIPATAAGELDAKKLVERIEAECKRIGAVLSETGVRVVGMGSQPVLKPKEAKRLKEAAKQDRREFREVFEELGLPKEAAKFAARGREVA